MYPMINRITHDIKEIRMWIIISMIIQVIWVIWFCVISWIINSTLNNIVNEQNVSIRENNGREPVLFEREHPFDCGERKRLQGIRTHRYDIRYTKEDDGIHLLDQESNRNNNIRHIGRNDFGRKANLHFLPYTRTRVFRNPEGTRTVSLSNNDEFFGVQRSKLIHVCQISESRIYVSSSGKIISASIFMNGHWSDIHIDKMSYSRNYAIFYFWQWNYRNEDKIKLRVEIGSTGLIKVSNFYYIEFRRMGM